VNSALLPTIDLFCALRDFTVHQMNGTYLAKLLQLVTIIVCEHIGMATAQRIRRLGVAPCSRHRAYGFPLRHIAALYLMLLFLIR
jgi:hypothetical protein